MIYLKLTVSLLCIASVVIKFGLDFWWKDKRTNEHKFWRNLLLWTALISGSISAVTMLVDTIAAEKASKAQSKKLDSIENFSAGGLAPDIFVELYTGPNHPTPPRMSLRPEFPNVVVVWVDNKKPFPIYDVD